MLRPKTRAELSILGVNNRWNEIRFERESDDHHILIIYWNIEKVFFFKTQKNTYIFCLFLSGLCVFLICLKCRQQSEKLMHYKSVIQLFINFNVPSTCTYFAAASSGLLLYILFIHNYNCSIHLTFYCMRYMHEALLKIEKCFSYVLVSYVCLRFLWGMEAVEGKVCRNIIHIMKHFFFI